MPKLMKIDFRGGLLRRLGCVRDQKGDDDVPVGGFAGADRFDQKAERSVGFDNEFTGSPHRGVGVRVKLAVLHVLADRLLDLGLGQEGARVDFLGAARFRLLGRGNAREQKKSRQGHCEFAHHADSFKHLEPPYKRTGLGSSETTAVEAGMNINPMRPGGVHPGGGFGMAFRISETSASRGKSPLVVIPSRTRTRCREGMTTVI